MNEKITKEQKRILADLLEHIGYDGHTIWEPSILAKFPKAVQRRFVRVYRSDGTPKGSIFRDGRVVKETMGVYGLNLLRGIASDLGLKYDGNVFGRGTEARNISSALAEWLKGGGK